MKYGVRKIDRDIKRKILVFREYAKETIDRIIDQIEANSLKSDE
jgi:hypothetical protein